MFDRESQIDTVEPGRHPHPARPLSAFRGRPLADLPGLEAFAVAVWQRYDWHQTSPEAGERDHWQDAFDLRVGDLDDTLTLLVRGAALPRRRAG